MSKSKNAIVYCFLSAALVGAFYFLLKLTPLTKETIVFEFSPYKIVRLITACGVFIAASVLVFVLCVKAKKIPALVKNIFLIIYSLVCFFLMMETVFMYVPYSHGQGNVALSHQMWMDAYWKPINKQGFRDEEISNQEIGNKDLIFVLGDSFAAGAGIKDIKDRFSDQLEMKLDNVEVLNFGINGFSTRNEVYLLSRYLQSNIIKKPKAVVLSYFGNDIVETSDEKYVHYRDRSGWQKFFIKNSYFLNFIYWRFNHDSSFDYVGHLHSKYSDPKTLFVHIKELAMLRALCETNDIDLYVVVFPFLVDLKSSEIYVDPVTQFFRNQNVPVLNVSEILKGIPIRERLVNSSDHHPSVKLHHLVAERLAEMIKM